MTWREGDDGWSIRGGNNFLLEEETVVEHGRREKLVSMLSQSRRRHGGRFICRNIEVLCVYRLRLYNHDVF